MKNNIAEKLLLLKKELGQATLVAVTKYSPLEDILLAYQAGHRDFGENRVPDLAVKAQAFFELGYTDVRWHFIGHLQSNKVKALLQVKNLWAIHSVSSCHLIEILNKEKQKNGNESLIKLFYQVNISHEEEKSGFESLADLTEAMAIPLHDHFQLIGFMGMAGIRSGDKVKAAHDAFKSLKQMRDQIDTQLALSMGMSDDYSIALEYETQFVRIGSLIFS